MKDTFTVPIGIVTTAQIAASPTGELLIVYEQTSVVSYVRSTNAGEDWSSPVSVASGTAPAPAICPETGVEFFAMHDGTNWVCYRLNSTGTFVNVGTIVLMGSDTGRGLEVNKSAGRELVFIANDSGSIRKFVSTDFGVNWNEI